MNTIPPALDPSLDAETIRQLRTIGVEYLGTHWSSYHQAWLHQVELATPSGRRRHVLTKTDEGIAALLTQGRAR